MKNLMTERTCILNISGPIHTQANRAKEDWTAKKYGWESLFVGAGIEVKATLSVKKYFVKKSLIPLANAV